MIHIGLVSQRFSVGVSFSIVISSEPCRCGLAGLFASWGLHGLTVREEMGLLKTSKNMDMIKQLGR
jgi:hypothetical protein